MTRGGGQVDESAAPVNATSLPTHCPNSA